MTSVRTRVLSKFIVSLLVSVAVLVVGFVSGQAIVIALGAVLLVLDLALILYGVVRTRQILARRSPPVGPTADSGQA